MLTAEQVHRDGDTLTRERLVEVCAKFRREIGSVYEVVAARIEQDHPHLSVSGGDR